MRKTPLFAASYYLHYLHSFTFIYIPSLQTSNIFCIFQSLHNLSLTQFSSCLSSIQFSSASHSILSLEYSSFSLLQQYLSSLRKFHDKTLWQKNSVTLKIHKGSWKVLWVNQMSGPNLTFVNPCIEFSISVFCFQFNQNYKMTYLSNLVVLKCLSWSLFSNNKLWMFLNFLVWLAYAYSRFVIIW